MLKIKPLNRPPPPALSSLACAVLLALSMLPAITGAQPLGTAPPGLVSNDKLLEAQAATKKALADLQAKDGELKAALARAKTAEDANKAAALALISRPEGVPPEQLEAARKERDSARAERDAAMAEARDLKPQLGQLQAQLREAQSQLKRAQSSASEDAALRDERDKLKRENSGQQQTIATLRGQVVDKDKALAQSARDSAQANAAARTAAAALAAQTATAAPPPSSTGPAPSTSGALPASAPTYVTVHVQSPAAGAPADLTELSVPNCGAACPSFIVIPNPGKVTLGNGAVANNEAITVDIRHRYAMGKTEVTVGQWKAFWNAPDRDYQPVKTTDTHCNWNDGDYAKDDRHPVRCVNVPDAEAYARWFAKKHGAALGVRIESIGLPSELEWEFAARGGRYAQKYLWDDNASDAEKCKHAQVHACPGDVVPVGPPRLPNGYRLFDMIGNTWEWTASAWQDKRRAIPSNGREAAAGVSFPRVVRGASFYITDVRLALGVRSRNTPGFRNNNIGFRLVARIAP